MIRTFKSAGARALAAVATFAISCAPAGDELGEAATVTDAINLNGDGVSSPLEVPLVVTLFNNTTGNGQSRMLVRDVPDLARMAFNDQAVRLWVRQGPSYAAWKARNGGAEPSVTFWANANYAGASMRVYAGNVVESAALTGAGLNARISSARFNDDAISPAVRPVAAQVAAMSSLDIVAVLYTGTGFTGSYLMMSSESTNLGVNAGTTFNGTVSSVQLLRGPNYTGASRLDLCGDLGFTGGCVHLTSTPTDDNVYGASIPDLGGLSMRFDNAARSARVRRPTCP